MAFTRQTVIDASPSGDSVKQAVLDLDADLTEAFDGLNQLQGAIALKLDASQKGVPSGVASLGADGKILREQLSPSELPVGMIAAFGLETLPAGTSWMECDGAELPAEDYPDLFGAIGYAFGGTGLNFKLPDLRGTFLRGWDHGRGKDPNAATRTGGDHVGSEQACAVQKHMHPTGANTGKADGGASLHDPGTWDTSQYKTGTIDYSLSDAQVSSVFPYAPRGPETRPVNVAVMYCIKWR